MIHRLNILFLLIGGCSSEFASTFKAPPDAATMPDVMTTPEAGSAGMAGAAGSSGAPSTAGSGGEAGEPEPPSPITGRTCETDDDCPGYCRLGTCSRSCLTHDDCGDGALCVDTTQSGLVCLRQCINALDCENNHVCRNKTCEAP